MADDLKSSEGSTANEIVENTKEDAPKKKVEDWGDSHEVWTKEYIQQIFNEPRTDRKPLTEPMTQEEVSKFLDKPAWKGTNKDDGFIGENEEALKAKNEGNEAYNEGNLDLALKCYSRAIDLYKNERALAVYLKNRAAVYLKQQKYKDALNDCDRSLEIVPRDRKALFRRSQALHNLGRFEEAYRDVLQIYNDSTYTKDIQSTLDNLHRIVTDRKRKNAQTGTKIESMTKIAFDVNEEKDKRETAMKNLLVLARETAASELMISSQIMQQIKSLLKVEKNRDIFVTGIRIVGELCKHSVEKTIAVVKDLDMSWFLEILDSDDQTQVYAAEYCIQVILNSYSGMDNKPDTKPNKELCQKYTVEIDSILTCLVNSINNRVISGQARDAIIELLIKNVHYTTLNWAEKLVEIGGVARLLDCCSELDEIKSECGMNITSSTRTIAAVCLSRIYENMYYDAARERFMQKVEEFMKDKLLTPDIESKVRVTAALTALLRGPIDVGNSLIGKEGIIEMILVMANSDDVLQQRVACECIVAAASKVDKAKAIISQGIDILKRLYKSDSEAIKVRALVGLCKLGSSGGTDAAMKPFAEGSNLKLAEACRRFLLVPDNMDLRKWAAEGLSYLTLDAEVKEKLIEDKRALKSLIELACTGDQSCLFGVVTTLVNLCNAYEKQEVIPEMVELAKFAKQHVPQEHELDDPDFVQKRIIILGKEGVTTALVSLGKTKSANSKELIARVLNSLCSEPELRGIVVQQGGVKLLINLALDGTDKGKRNASQALARIAITMNPEVAFPGQRSLEVVRPLISLLHPECSGLENFEALMALCNLAQMNETARQRILKDGGLQKIEHYMYEDHQYLCRAAVQCITNLTMSPDVVRKFEMNNDRVKFLVSLAMDEDKDTSMAASGALAILTEDSKICCEKMFDSKNWLESLHVLLANPVTSIQYRGVCIVRNIINLSKECTEKLMETDIMEILMALSQLPDNNKEQVRKTAEEALKLAEKWGVIKKPEEDRADVFA